MQSIHLLAMQVHHLAIVLGATPTASSGGSVPAPTTDTTGTNQALINIAKWAAGLVSGFLMLAFVWQGFQYMLTHDLNRSTQLKIAAAGILRGTMIVLLAINLAPEFVKLITGREQIRDLA